MSYSHGNGVPVAWYQGRRQYYRLKNLTMPQSPKTPEEIIAAFANVDIMNTYGMTMGGVALYPIGGEADDENGVGAKPTRFLKYVYACTKFAYTIFASDPIIHALQSLPEDRRHIYMDGTFKIVPNGQFSQLLVIHCEFYGKVSRSLISIFHFISFLHIHSTALSLSVPNFIQTIPFAYALMTSRTTDAYVHLFRYINENIVKLNPASFMTDYEIPMRKALTLVFPGVDQFTCWFHFCQAVRRHALKIPGFVQAIKTNHQMAEIYHKLLNLPLLPPQHIDIAFSELKKTAMALDPINAKIIFDYYETQWIKKVRLIAIAFTIAFLAFIPIPISFIYFDTFYLTPQEGTENISVFGRHSRTTGSCEAYNCDLNKNFKHHGNFYSFCLGLGEEEFKKRTDLRTYLDTAGESARQDSRSVSYRFILFLIIFCRWNGKGRF